MFFESVTFAEAQQKNCFPFGLKWVLVLGGKINCKKNAVLMEVLSAKQKVQKKALQHDPRENGFNCVLYAIK